MNVGSYSLPGILITGIGATLIMDIWNLFLYRAFGIRSLSYCLLGRWLCHMPGGTFRHTSIAASPGKPFECMTGWIAHYSIGIVFAFMLIVLTSGHWLQSPVLLTGVIYGIATAVFPLFVMQPSLGLGIASSKTPYPAQARVKSLGTHIVFGIGLYTSALAAGPVLQVLAR